jgi:hypothetical protein
MSEMKFKNGRQEEFSRSNFSKLLDSRKLLRSVRNSFREEQRNLILGRKSRQEEDEYFNFVKFLLSSPDRASLR